jgi:hypothetical protein
MVNDLLAVGHARVSFAGTNAPRRALFKPVAGQAEQIFSAESRATPATAACYAQAFDDEAKSRRRKRRGRIPAVALRIVSQRNRGNRDRARCIF